MNVLIYGIGGAMGKVLLSCCKESSDVVCVCGVDKYVDKKTISVPVYDDCSTISEKVDCIIDFSNHVCIYDYLPYAIKNSIPCVIATTGYNEEELNYIAECAKLIPILKSGNMSLGINLLLQLSKLCAKSIGDIADIEIIEHHHNKKIDAPSGTALLLADGIKKELPDSNYVLGRSGEGKRQKNDIGISAVRGGTIVGKHEVMFILNNEIVTLKHEAQSKSILAYGSINAARFIVGKPVGMYTMEDVFQH